MAPPPVRGGSSGWDGQPGYEPSRSQVDSFGVGEVPRKGGPHRPSRAHRPAYPESHRCGYPGTDGRQRTTLAD